jgi:hypothetical protein
MHKFHNSKKIRIIKKINIGDVYKPFTSDWQAVNKKKPTTSFFFIPTIEWFSNLGLDRLYHDLF